MIDLHTHTLVSDGELIPSEMARRAEFIGYRCLGLADHVDSSNIETSVPTLVRVAEAINPLLNLTVVPGAELTHVPPGLIAELTAKARNLGAAYVVVHGESPVEPVAPGTNRAAILAGVNILAHPGLITLEEARLAAEKGVFLEISARGGHSLTNGHVARMAKQAGAGLVLNTDAHSHHDLATLEFARKVVLGAGLTEDDFKEMLQRSYNLVTRLGYGPF